MSGIYVTIILRMEAHPDNPRLQLAYTRYGAATVDREEGFVAKFRAVWIPSTDIVPADARSLLGEAQNYPGPKLLHTPQSDLPLDVDASALFNPFRWGRPDNE